MFTIPTLPKILLILLVVGVVWWWFRRSQVRARQRDEELGRKPRSSAKNKPAKPIEDMAQCKACGAYVPAAGARSCGRAGCPY